MTTKRTCNRCGVTDVFVVEGPHGPRHQNESSCIKVLRLALSNANADKKFLLNAIDRWWTEGDNNALIIVRRQVK